MKALFANIKNIPPESRKQYGEEVNKLKQEVESWVSAATALTDTRQPIDVTAPFDVYTPADNRPSTFTAAEGSVHPLMRELDIILDIYYHQLD